MAKQPKATPGPVAALAKKVENAIFQSPESAEKQKLFTRLYKNGNAVYVRVDPTCDGFSSEVALNGRKDELGRVVLMCGENVLPVVKDFASDAVGFRGKFKIGESWAAISVPWEAVRQIQDQTFPG